MSVTSTRKVSASYSSPTRGAYEAAQGRQSFVETIDTSNNVSINDEHHNGSRQQYQQLSSQEDGEFSSSMEHSKAREADNSLKTSSHRAPLLDNDEEDLTVSQNKSVGIYGTNQEISEADTELSTNPYLKYFYENNELIEDIDEFV